MATTDFDDIDLLGLGEGIDENEVQALVASLESNIATPGFTQAFNTPTDSTFNNNQIGGIPHQNSSLSNNGSLSTNASVSNQGLSNSEGIGISSIFDSSSTPASGEIVSNLDPNRSKVAGTGSNGMTDVKKLPVKPIIRIVSQAKSSLVPSSNKTSTPRGRSLISQGTVLTGATDNVQVPHVTSMGTTRTTVVAASSTNNKVANSKSITTATEQRPLNVTHNVRAQPIQVTKDQPLIHPNFVVKQVGGKFIASALKQEGPHTGQHHIVKQEMGTSTPVHIKQHPAGIRVEHTGTMGNTPRKGVLKISNPNLVRAQAPPQQVKFVQQPTVVATQANMTQPSYVSNVSGAQGTLQLVNVSPNMMNTGMHVTTPVQTKQQPRIAPKRQGAGTNVTYPQGLVLRKNEAGQLVLCQPVAGQAGGAVINPSNVIIHKSASNSSTPAASNIVQPKAQSQGQSITLAQPLQTPLVIPQPALSLPTPPTAQDATLTIMTIVKKSYNFLSILLKTAAGESTTIAENVRELIQKLIDAEIEPEVFVNKLMQMFRQAKVPSTFLPVLKKSLPHLRQCMQQKKMTIDGIRAPPSEIVTATPTAPAALTSVPQPPQVSTPSATVAQQRVAIPKQTVVSGMQVSEKAALSPLVRPSLSLITPESNKFLIQPSKATPPQTASSSMIKTGASATVLASHPSLQKLDTNTFTTLSGMKRKFGALLRDENTDFIFDSRDDNDDINDVATMGGVNLFEESKNSQSINSEPIGSQVRSCQDRPLIPEDVLMNRISAIAKKKGLDIGSPDVVRLISKALEQKLTNIIASLSVAAEHRMDQPSMDSRYEKVSDVRQQLRFLGDLDKEEKRRHEEQESELLRWALKSRSYGGDPEQLSRLKQRAKELHQTEAEEAMQRRANETALAAIGPNKRQKLNSGESTTQGKSGLTNGPVSSTGRQSVVRQPRIKRVTMKDLQHVMEQDPDLCKSALLYKTYLM